MATVVQMEATLEEVISRMQDYGDWLDQSAFEKHVNALEELMNQAQDKYEESELCDSCGEPHDDCVCNDEEEETE
jgi:vacuolar-type H+-ATPase subunit E/Vma4